MPGQKRIFALDAPGIRVFGARKTWMAGTRPGHDEKVRTHPVVIGDGKTPAKGPYMAGTFPVHIGDSCVIIET